MTCRPCLVARLSLSLACALIILSGGGRAGLALGSGSLGGSTVRSEAGSPVSLPCPGLGLTPFVVSLRWGCRGCGPAGGRSPRTLLTYRDGAPPAGSGRHQAEPEPEEKSESEPEPESQSQSESGQPRLRLDDTTFALSISRTRASDTGEYFCVVNSRQQPRGTVRLEIRDVPDAPGRPLVLTFSSRTANISWTPPRRTNFSPVHHYLVHVRESERGPWHRSLRTASNRTSYQVTGLRPYTVYSFRLTAVNGVGAGRPGAASYPVHTLREPPSGLVGELRAASSSPSSVRLSWRQAAPDTLHGEFLGYQLTYRCPATGASRSLVITEQDVTALVVTGLEPFTEYLFSLSIRNPRGLGPAARVTGRTRQSVPGPPAAVRYTSVGSTWAVLMWTPPAQRNGELLRYWVNVSGSPGLRPLPATERRWLQHRVDGLSPFTEYLVGVSAETAAGRGRARQVRLRTDTAAPGRPVLLGVSCLPGGGARLRWRGPAHSGPPPVSFFTIGVRNARDAKFRLTRTATGGNTITIRHLDPGITHFKMQAVRRSRYSQSAVYRGEFSEPWSVLLPSRNSDCSQFRLIHPAPDSSSPALGVRLLAGLAPAALIVLCIIIAFFRRRSRLGQPAPAADMARPDWRQEAIPARLFAGYGRDLEPAAGAGFEKDVAAVEERASGGRHSSTGPGRHLTRPDSRANIGQLGIAAG